MGKVNTAVNIGLDGNNVTITIDGLDTVARALGELQSKTPAAVKVAVNQTARQARKLMITAAKARYVVNAAGARHLSDLKQKKKASNTDPSATLFISKMRNDLGYFENEPAEAYSGGAVFMHSPAFYKARVLVQRCANRGEYVQCRNPTAILPVRPAYSPALTQGCTSILHHEGAAGQRKFE